MVIGLKAIGIGALALSSTPFAVALSPSEIPADTPVSQLIKTANARLAAGNAKEALTYFDVAISRDPQNYLTFFKRGATYLSIGRNAQAQQDFDKVLSIKPGFEGALLQRANIKSRNGDWDAAKADLESAGKNAESPEIAELEEAKNAAVQASEAHGKGDWETCVTAAGIAIHVAGTNSSLRKIRAQCRFEKGEIIEGVSDLQHVVQISSGSIEPHLKISAMTFYTLGETDKGLAAIRRCLQSDPDSKACMKMMKREKAIAKQLTKAKQFIENKKPSSAVKLLIKQGEENGLIDDVLEDTNLYKQEGNIHQNANNGLYNSLIELTCDAYISMNNKKRGEKYCMQALEVDPTFLNGLLLKAEAQLDKDEYEPCINTLNEAKEHHPNNQKIQEMLHKAHKRLKISKQKDYYKVLGLTRDADDRDIKRSYRKLTMQYHPDKASRNGMDKDEAEKKMAEVNEAYEILSDPELRARFDNGDDPNNPENQGSPFQGSPFGGGGGQQFFFRNGPGGGGNPFGGGGFKFQGGGFQF